MDTSFTETMAESSPISVELTEADIPDAALDEPLEAHTIPELKWWLLCHGVHARSSLRKMELIERYFVILYTEN